MDFGSLPGLRDVGMLDGIRKGILFRSAQPDEYPAEEFVAFARLVGLRTVIDLRTERELAEMGLGYPSAFLRSVERLWSPVSTTLTAAASPASTEREALEEWFYATMPREPSFREALRQVVQVVTDRSRCPAMVHCRAGTDRTGMVVALILLAVGVDVNAVTRDYLQSPGRTRPDNMARFLKSINAAGGPEDYLRSVTISQHQLNVLQANLRVGDTK